MVSTMVSFRGANRLEKTKHKKKEDKRIATIHSIAPAGRFEVAQGSKPWPEGAEGAVGAGRPEIRVGESPKGFFFGFRPNPPKWRGFFRLVSRETNANKREPRKKRVGGGNSVELMNDVSSLFGYTMLVAFPKSSELAFWASLLIFFLANDTHI